MADDLYYEWLGVPHADGRPVDMPPDHYTLLGLPHFCHHAGAIEEAARRQLAKLDKYSIHPDKTRRDAATRMMNEVAAARVVLTDEARCRQYAANLSKNLGIPIPAKPVAPPADLIPIDDGGYELAETSAAPVDQGDLQALDKSLIGTDAPEIKAEADLTAPRDRPMIASMSLNVMIMAVVGVIVLIGIIVGVVLMVKAPDSAPPVSNVTTSAGGSTAGTAPVAPVGVTAPAPDLPDVTDQFDRPLVGSLYRVSTSVGDSSAVSIVNEQLRLTVPGSRAGSVTAEYTPRVTTSPIRKLSFRIKPDRYASFTVALAAGGLKLSLESVDNGMQVRASPGFPAADDGWLTIEPKDEFFTLESERVKSGTNWLLNGQLVATSPDISERGTPTIRFIFYGPGGSTTLIDDVQVWYQKP